MSDLRKAAQQALEALTTYDGTNGESKRKRVLAALRAALAEPVQEPVAWAYVNSDGECEQIEYDTPPNDPSITPLYAAPPQRKPLTDEEIRDLWSWAMTAEAERTATTQQHAFARAIERAHGIET